MSSQADKNDEQAEITGSKANIFLSIYEITKTPMPSMRVSITVYEIYKEVLFTQGGFFCIQGDACVRIDESHMDMFR